MAEDMTLASNNDFKSYIPLLHLMEFFIKRNSSHILFVFLHQTSKYCNLSASNDMELQKINRLKVSNGTADLALMLLTMIIIHQW